MNRSIILVVILAACGDPGPRAPTLEERAQQLVPVASPAQRQCVTETIKQSNEADLKSDLIGRLVFCTDGKTLSICTSDQGCISVNLPTEAPDPVGVTARPAVQR